jgi:hypothetical protein
LQYATPHRILHVATASEKSHDPMPSSPRRFDCFDIFDFLKRKRQWNQPPLINNQTENNQTGLGYAAGRSR